jgi:hypothetical protein
MTRPLSFNDGVGEWLVPYHNTLLGNYKGNSHPLTHPLKETQGKPLKTTISMGERLTSCRTNSQGSYQSMTATLLLLEGRRCNRKIPLIPSEYMDYFSLNWGWSLDFSVNIVEEGYDWTVFFEISPRKSYTPVPNSTEIFQIRK